MKWPVSPAFQLSLFFFFNSSMFENFLRFLWAVRNQSFYIRVCSHEVLPRQETDWTWRPAESRILASPPSRVSPPYPGSSTRTVTAPELVETDSQEKKQTQTKGSQEVLNILPLPTDGEVFLWRGRLCPCALGACAPAGVMGCDRVSPGREPGTGAPHRAVLRNKG